MPRLLTRPHFAALAAQSEITRGVSSVFLTNTYPVHASVVTGVTAAYHGQSNNTEAFPVRHPQRHYKASGLRVKTLWQAAAEKGLTVAAVLWPITGGAREIRWNVPELMAQPGESQVAINLRYGSKLLQIGLILRHRALMKDIGTQPGLDSFATACMTDILRRKNPDMALAHLTALDALCHRHGLDAPELEMALDSLDENLGKLLAAAGERDVILFSDHAQLNVEHLLFPNRLLETEGLLAKDAEGEYVRATAQCFFECSGGSAFFHPHGPECPNGPDEAQLLRIRAQTEVLEGFGRFLTFAEMRDCGRESLPFGFAARPGYACAAYPSEERGEHGYPTDYADYQVFYLLRTADTSPGTKTGGSLLDIAPLAAQLLDLRM